MLASWNLQVGGHKFSLRSSNFYSALNRILQDESSVSWRAHMDSQVAGAVLLGERSAERIATRPTMSGLYAANDTRGYKPPIYATSAVVLEWRDAKPIAAHLFDGYDHTVVAINQETSARFKGVVKLAAWCIAATVRC